MLDVVALGGVVEIIVRVVALADFLVEMQARERGSQEAKAR